MLPLYGSERVQGWPKDDTIVILAEGEKAADALLQAGFCALGTVTGAGSTPGPEALGVLEGFEIVLWPDNDDQGRAHMERAARVLQGVAAGVSIFTWHDAPEKGDAADHPAVLQGARKNATSCSTTSCQPRCGCHRCHSHLIRMCHL
jgi:DNA primase